MCFIKRKQKPLIKIRYRLKGTEEWEEDGSIFTSLHEAKAWVENTANYVWTQYDWEAYEDNADGK